MKVIGDLDALDDDDRTNKVIEVASSLRCKVNSLDDPLSFEDVEMSQEAHILPAIFKNCTERLIDELAKMVHAKRFKW